MFFIILKSTSFGFFFSSRLPLNSIIICCPSPKRSGQVCWDPFIYSILVSLKGTVGKEKKNTKENRNNTEELRKVNKYNRKRDPGIINFPLGIFLTRNMKNNTSKYLQFPKGLVISLAHLILTTTLWERQKENTFQLLSSLWLEENIFKDVLLCYQLKSGPFNYTYDITHLTYAEDLLIIEGRIYFT